MFKKLIILIGLIIGLSSYSQSQTIVKDSVMYITGKSHDTILAISKTPKEFVRKMDSITIAGRKKPVCAQLFAKGKLIQHTTYRFPKGENEIKYKKI